MDAVQAAKGSAASTVYSTGSGASFKQQGEKFDPGELADAAVVARSGIMRKYGKNDEADRMEATAQAKKLTGFQISGQQREQTINKQFGEWAAQTPGATVQEKQAKLAEIQGSNGAGVQAVEGGMRAMQIGELQRGEDRAKAKQAHEQAIAEYVKANPFQVGQDGKPVIDDQALVRLGQFQARDLAGRGMLQEARAAAGETMQYQKNLVTMQTEERKQAATLAASAALAGDMKPAIEVYNKFVPDGYQITGARQGKNGEIILDRVDASGQPAEPKTVKDVKAMVAGLSGLADPSAVMNYLNNEEELVLKKASLKLQEASLKLQEGNSAEQVRHNKASGPAAVQTAVWLIENGVAKDKKEAWALVGTSKEQSREAAVQSMAAKLMGNVMYANDPAKATADAERVVDSIRSKPTQSAAPAGGKFEEGKVYTDASGKKAKYVNGTFVEVK
jgi:hypothetical protein